MKISLPSPGTLAFIVFAIIFIAMGLCGCATQTLVKVDPMVLCDDNVEQRILNEPCDSATALPPGSTFEAGLDGKRKGDASLNSCSLKTKKLQQVLKACHDATVNHNALIESLNKK